MDYSQQPMNKALRPMARAKGWTGADMLDATKDDLAYFLTTSQRPDIRHELVGNNLHLSRRPATVHELLELADTIRATVPKSLLLFQEQADKKTGRPAIPVPVDMEPLLKCFRNADQHGVPFYRTGKKGLYARRNELPDGFNQIGRDRMERIILELIQRGVITSKDGQLTVPENDFSNDMIISN